MISGLKIISIYDPATGTVVQLNKVSEEGEFVKQAISVKNTQGNLVYAGDESNFEFTAYDNDGYSQLETWMKNKTPVRLVTYGVEENILWYEDAKITVRKNYGFAVGNLNSFTVQVSARGGEHDIHIGQNLLHISAGWRDADSDGKADGYEFLTTNTTLSFDVSGYQILSEEAPAAVATVFGDVVYPIASALFTFAAEYYDSGVFNTIRLGALDFSDALIGGESGDELVELITPPNTYTLRSHCLLNRAITSDVKFRHPMLVPGSKTYSKIEW